MSCHLTKPNFDGLFWKGTLLTLKTNFSINFLAFKGESPDVSIVPSVYCLSRRPLKLIHASVHLFFLYETLEVLIPLQTFSCDVMTLSHYCV